MTWLLGVSILCGSIVGGVVGAGVVLLICGVIVSRRGMGATTLPTRNRWDSTHR